jgi:hypothetical protein
MTDVFASETATSERMPFLHWLNLLHEDTDHKFWPLAHLVLSGGPENVWLNRFDLNPHYVLEDVRLFYAAGKAQITAAHLDLAREMIKVYYDEAPTVAELVYQRKAHEYEITEARGTKVVRAAMTDALSEADLSDRVPYRAVNDLVPHVTDADGRDIELRPNKAPRLAVSQRCVQLRDNGLKCTNFATPGDTHCTTHGGHLYTAEELRNIHQVTKTKLLAAGEKAVDSLISLLNSTNDMVRLKAAEAILDRTGFAPGIEISVVAGPQGDRTPADIIAAHLARLAGETPVLERMDARAPSSNGHDSSSTDTDEDTDTPAPPEEIVEAETVEDKNDR